MMKNSSSFNIQDASKYSSGVIVQISITLLIIITHVILKIGAIAAVIVT
jgi:hypothetical protein